MDTDKKNNNNEFTQECVHKKCDFEEVLELSDNFIVASDRWVELTDRCRLDKYRCDSENTLACLNFWQARQCVCKQGFTGGDCGKCIVKLVPGETCFMAFSRAFREAEKVDDNDRLVYLKKTYPGRGK